MSTCWHRHHSVLVALSGYSISGAGRDDLVGRSYLDAHRLRASTALLQVCNIALIGSVSSIRLTA